MNKKGAEAGLWMKIFYLILAIIIVYMTYNYVYNRTTSNIELGYVSREIGLDNDAALSAPDGKVMILERFDKKYKFKIEDGVVEVKREDAKYGLSYNYVKSFGYDVRADSREAKSEIKIEKDNGLRVSYG